MGTGIKTVAVALVTVLTLVIIIIVSFKIINEDGDANTEGVSDNLCSLISCQNGGTCDVINGNAVCTCTDEYTGEFCDKHKCSLIACKNGGKCVIENKNAVCKCNERYTGTFCEIDKCSLIKCENGGTCDIRNGKSVCICTDSYIGDRCEKKCNCENGKCKEIAEKIECICYPEYGKYEENVCKACKCGKGANCTFSAGSNNSGKIKTCICPDGFQEEDGVCVDVTTRKSSTTSFISTATSDPTDPDTDNPCSSNPCKNGATCEKDNLKPKCICLPGYKGEWCEIDVCSPNPCKNNGICKRDTGKPVCSCADAYIGDVCQTDKCSLLNCKNSGKCYIKNKEAVCNCTERFTGKNCEIDSCEGVTCFNEGTCKKGKCSCIKNFTGEFCQLFPKDVCEKTFEVCAKSGGHCKSEDNDNVKCLCPPVTSFVENEGCKIMCDENKNQCKHGGICEESNGKKFCTCREGTSGDLCEIVNDCEQNICGSESISGARCEYDTNKNKTICACKKDNLHFDKVSMICRKTCDRTNNNCKHMGTCEKRGDYDFCNCKKGTRGHHCEEIVGCNSLKCKNSTCVYDGATEKAFCKCADPKFRYDAGMKKCIPIDECILKILNNQCTKLNEICENGKCKCKENYTYTEGQESCEVNKCAFCPRNTDCIPPGNSDNPCECKNGYFNGNECIKYNKCEIGISKCEHKCDANTGNCLCEAGFTPKGEKCEKNKETKTCDLKCRPGTCIIRGNSPVCICPTLTHKKQNNVCIDFCSASGGNPPNWMKCPNKCESDGDDGIRCKCEGIYEQAEDGVHCKRKEMCKEPEVTEESSKKRALCKEENNKDGYKLYCDEKYAFDNKNICKSKCDLKQDECIRQNAVCELNEKNEAACVCPPLLKRNEKGGPCNKIAEASYSGEISLLKSKYAVENEHSRRRKRSTGLYDNAKLKKDLELSIKYAYGKDNVENVHIIECNPTGDLLECKLEFQLKRLTDDANALISPKYCYVLEEKKDYCVVNGLIVKRDESLNGFKQTDPCIVEETFCDKSTSCKPGKTGRTFECKCKEGFRVTGSYNPVIYDKDNVVQKCADVNECDLKIDKCPNNTECINTYGNYTCECKPGFRRKEPNKDPKEHGCEAVCNPNPCENEGECFEKRNHGFMCRCKPTYTGLNCNETVTARPIVDDKKSAAIVGGVLGTLLVLALILFVLVYKRMKNTKYDDDDEYGKHRQRSVLAEINRLQSKQRGESSYDEIDPNRKNRLTRLQRDTFEDSREIPGGRIIPRVQAGRNKSTDQGIRNSSGISGKDEDRLQNKMHYRNEAYDEEE